MTPVPLEERASGLQMCAEKIGSWSDALPDTDFYLYYIETDKDLDLATGQKSGLCDAFFSGLTLPRDHLGLLSVDSFDDYHRCFLKTDHHWNADGALQGYRDICGMLGLEPLSPIARHTVSGRYLGTRAAGMEGISAEDFSVDVYAPADMTIEIPAGPLPGYSRREAFAADALPQFSYGSVYGADCGELIFRGGGDGGTMLVMGDSYDNAIAEPLASLFSECRFVDLRSYAAETGSAFDMVSYVQAHDIGSVLLIGGIDYFTRTLPAEGGN